MGGKKRRRIILIAQCLINPYCRVHVLGQNFALSHELMSYLMGQRVGVIQYPCPETTAMGLARNPQGRRQYDNVFFREHCKELFKVPMFMVREFIRSGYRLVCFIGLENSPTCGIRWGRHKVNRYATESAVPAGDAEGGPVLMGIMAEILAEELTRHGVTIPFLEFPTRSGPGSPRRAAFWEALTREMDREPEGRGPPL
jgi:predicted secreted protein